MSRQPVSVLAWSLWSCWLAIGLATVWFGRPDQVSYAMALSLLGYATVGALVASRRPGNAVGWLLLVAALTLSASTASGVYAATMSNPGHDLFAWLSTVLFNAGLAIMLVFLPLCFPSGRLSSFRWRLAWWFALVTTCAWVLVLALAPGRLDTVVDIENPLGVHGTAQRVLDVVASILPFALVTTMLLTALSLLVRFRGSRGVERQQLKWFVFAVLLPWPGLAMSLIGDHWLVGGFGVLVNEIGWTLFLVAIVLGIPTATGLAILRYRLYDIDVVIHRTLVYSILTATLGAVYAGLILVPPWLLHASGDNDLLIAASTLAMAALVRPARTRIQAMVDRRFFRRKYDATLTLRQFSNSLSHVVDLDEVGSELCSVVDRSMQPRHISLWLRH